MVPLSETDGRTAHHTRYGDGSSRGEVEAAVDLFALGGDGVSALVAIHAHLFQRLPPNYHPNQKNEIYQLENGEPLEGTSGCRGVG